MAGRMGMGGARIGVGPYSASPQWPALRREAGFFDRPLANGPGGFGPVTPGPGRRGRPEPPPRRAPPPPKWLQYLIRAISVASGAATLAFLVYQSADPPLSDKVDMAFGLPGAMLIGMLAIILVALGLGD